MSNILEIFGLIEGYVAYQPLKNNLLLNHDQFPIILGQMINEVIQLGKILFSFSLLLFFFLLLSKNIKLLITNIYPF